MKLGASFPVGKDWETRIQYLSGRILETEDAKEPDGRPMTRTAKAQCLTIWENLLHRAMEARDKLKEGNRPILVQFVKTDDGKTAFQEKDGERPTPTPFDGEEQGFNPPKETP